MTQRIVSIHNKATAAYPSRTTKPQRPSLQRAQASATTYREYFAPPTDAQAVTSATPLSAKLAVSIAEAAQLLSISRSHLYPIVMRGEIPSFHIGRSHLIRVSALEAWIRQQEEAAA
jgi:excisionase family DNA binding protein